MNNLTEKSFPLYIHIPFCVSKCAYCDFFSMPCKNSFDNDSHFRKIVSDEYVASLMNEAAFFSHKYNIISWSSVYVGGGTPSVLTPAQVKTLFDGIKNAASFASSAEVTFEANPADITSEMLYSLFENGVNRLSLGVQSLNDEALLRVSRRSSRSEILQALRLISENWQGELSLDLISALPFESELSFCNGIKTLLLYKPTHISLYALTLEKGTPLFEQIESGKIRYDFEKADLLWLKGRDILLSEGYTHYEVSNFCKNGKQSLHNLSYWKLKDYIGIGSGSTGTIYGNGAKNGKRYTNTKNIFSYISFWKNNFVKSSTIENFPQDVEYLDFATERFEFFMMGLRMLKGISKNDFENRFGEFPESVEKLFREWQQNGNAKIVFEKGDVFFSLTESGLLFLNKLLEDVLETLSS